MIINSVFFLNGKAAIKLNDQTMLKIFWAWGTVFGLEVKKTHLKENQMKSNTISDFQ